MPTTLAEKEELFPYSNSRLEDICMCPRWGVVHAKRQYEGNYRSMALEAGGLMHNVFAILRVWQLGRRQGLKKHAEEAGKRIFGKERWAEIKDVCESHKDERDDMIAHAFAALHTANWEDDDGDPTRTMSNMETASMTYVDERFPFLDAWPIWVEDKKKPKSRVGIEQVFDVVLRYSDKSKIRYIGTIDGLVLDVHNDNRKSLEENKTASRLDVGWQQAFDMRHQITGYSTCSTAVFGFPVFFGNVWGLKIKWSAQGENCVRIPVERDYEAINTWAWWVYWVVQYLHRPYESDFETAPTFTHSCNRYFRPCSLLPFCSDTAEGRKIQYEDMVPVDPSPSERAILEN